MLFWLFVLESGEFWQTYQKDIMDAVNAFILSGQSIKNIVAVSSYSEIAR